MNQVLVVVQDFQKPSLQSHSLCLDEYNPFGNPLLPVLNQENLQVFLRQWHEPDQKIEFLEYQ
jgi:hypothetical protein